MIRQLMKNDRTKWTLRIFGIGSILVFVLYFNLPDTQKSTLNAISLFGTYASVFGLAVAGYQIFLIKGISETTEQEVKNTHKRINQIISIADLSKANKIVQEIQHFIGTEKHELCLLRMRDLKEIIIQSKYSSNLSTLTETDEYNEIIQKLSIDLNNISDFSRSNKKVNFGIINENLEHISTIILNYESNIKSHGNTSR